MLIRLSIFIHIIYNGRAINLSKIWGDIFFLTQLNSHVRDSNSRAIIFKTRDFIISLSLSLSLYVYIHHPVDLIIWLYLASLPNLNESSPRFHQFVSDSRTNNKTTLRKKINTKQHEPSWWIGILSAVWWDIDPTTASGHYFFHVRICKRNIGTDALTNQRFHAAVAPPRFKNLAGWTKMNQWDPLIFHIIREKD